MFKLIILVHCLLCQLVDSDTTYDQRQDGPWNLEIDVKNVQIVALMKGNKEEYVDYDYAYDYSEMTIKPPNGTKPKPINSTITSTEIPFANTTNTANDEATNKTMESITNDKKNNTVVDAEVEITTLPPTNDNITTNASLVTNITAAVTTPMTNCKKGFVQNSNGHCELELQGPSNALRKLVKLSQKLKWQRANRHNHEGSV